MYTLARESATAFDWFRIDHGRRLHAIPAGRLRSSLCGRYGVRHWRSGRKTERRCKHCLREARALPRELRAELLAH